VGSMVKGLASDKWHLVDFQDEKFHDSLQSIDSIGKKRNVPINWNTNRFWS